MKLNGTEELVVDQALYHIRELGEPVEQTVSGLCALYNSANAEDEYTDEPFHNEEADYTTVLKYVQGQLKEDKDVSN